MADKKTRKETKAVKAEAPKVEAKEPKKFFVPSVGKYLTQEEINLLKK